MHKKERQDQAQGHDEAASEETEQKEGNLFAGETVKTGERIDHVDEQVGEFAGGWHGKIVIGKTWAVGWRHGKGAGDG